MSKLSKGLHWMGSHGLALLGIYLAGFALYASMTFHRANAFQKGDGQDNSLIFSILALIVSVTAARLATRKGRNGWAERFAIDLSGIVLVARLYMLLT